MNSNAKITPQATNLKPLNYNFKFSTDRTGQRRNTKDQRRETPKKGSRRGEREGVGGGWGGGEQQQTHYSISARFVYFRNAYRIVLRRLFQRAERSCLRKQTNKKRLILREK